MSENITFLEWYDRFQDLIKLWEELSTNKNWIDTHKAELDRLGLNPEETSRNLSKDIEIISKQIIHFNEENKNVNKGF